MQITVISKTKVKASKYQAAGWEYEFTCSEEIKHNESVWGIVDGRSFYATKYEFKDRTIICNRDVTFNLEIGDVIDVVLLSEIPTARIEISDKTLKSIAEQLNTSRIGEIKFKGWLTGGVEDGIDKIFLNLKSI